jgi:hypothetical protein
MYLSYLVQYVNIVQRKIHTVHTKIQFSYVQQYTVTVTYAVPRPSRHGHNQYNASDQPKVQ